jgi:cell division protein FtsB
MARQSPTPKQLLTLRQVIIIIGILVLAFFAVRYVQNVLRYRQLHAELVKMEGHISAAETEKEMVNRSFDESLSPAVVEEFARGEMNWVRKDDEVVITVGDEIDSMRVQKPGTDASNNASGDTSTPNWQLWLDLVIDGGIGQ